MKRRFCPYALYDQISVPDKSINAVDIIELFMVKRPNEAHTFDQ
jgi:hypothetical protein